MKVRTLKFFFLGGVSNRFWGRIGWVKGQRLRVEVEVEVEVEVKVKVEVEGGVNKVFVKWGGGRWWGEVGVGFKGNPITSPGNFRS